MTIPLSGNQLSMWLAEQLLPGITITAARADVEGPFAPDQFDAAWHHVVSSDPALRLVLGNDDATPVLVISDETPTLAKHRIAAADVDSFVQAWMSEQRQAQHEPGHELFAGCLITVSETHHVFLLVSNHIVSDGTSLHLVPERVFTTYLGEPVRQSDGVQGARQAIESYLRSPQYPTDRTFWSRYVDTIEQVCPPERERTGLRIDVHHVRRNFGDRINLALKRLERLGVNPVKALAAAATFLDARLRGENQTVIGLVASGRAREIREQPVAFLSNILPTLQKFDLNDTVQSFISNSWSAFREVLTHQQIQPVPEIQSLTSRMANSYTSTVNIVRIAGNRPLGDASRRLALEAIGPAHDTNYLFDLGNPDDPTFILEVDSSRFSARAANALADRYLHVLEQFCNEQTRTLKDIELTTPSEQSALAEGNVEAPESCRNLVDLFQDGVNRSLSRAAVTSAKTTMTYAELDRLTTTIAHLLIATHDVGPDSIVGILMDRSHLSVVSMISILKAGATYMPIDPKLPQRRITEMIDDAEPVLVMCQAIYHDLAEKSDGQRRQRIVHITPLVELAQWLEPIAEPLPNPHPDSGAYVIYTSGTTGRPKGVVVTHRAASAWIADWAPRYEFSPEDVVSCTHSFSFDVSFWECWAAFCSGAELVVMDERVVADPPTLVSDLARAKVTVFGATPSALTNVIDSGAWDPQRLRVRAVTVAGEALDESATRQWQEESGIAFYNMYGPTETNVVTGVSVPGVVDGSIGGPLDQVRAYVLDETLNIVPPYGPGELYLAGAHLARGYHGQPGLTARRFVANPYGDGDRLYRTGDKVRWVPTAVPGFELVYEGRNDGQVKLRGYRLELSEVARAVAEYPEVKNAVAVIREERAGVKQLVAYATTMHPEDHLDSQQVKAWLSKVLPSYMVPTAVVGLDAFPLTRNGKLDEHALPSPEYVGTADESVQMSALERDVADCFGALLGVTNVGPSDSFIDLGGDSLQAIALVRAIAARTGVQLSPGSVFTHLTPSQLAAAIEEVPTYPHRSLANLFRTFVRKNGNRRALSATDSAELLTYTQLDELSDRFAALVQSHDVGAGDIVALLMTRSPRCVVAILGCLKAGAAYTFIEPSNPRLRTREVLDDLAGSLLVVDVDQQQLADLQLGEVDRILNWSSPSTWPEAHKYRPVTTSAANPAYVIYTSGTTGRPKGVVVSNASALAWLDGKRRFYRARESDVVATTASFAFDISVSEIWVAFASGAELVVFDSETQRSPEALASQYRKKNVTVVMQTPAMFRAILDVAGHHGDSLAELELTCVTVGGEALSEPNRHRFERWWNTLMVRPRFYNLYGPTETTMTVCGSALPIETTGSIGPPTGDVTFYVLDEQLRQLGPGSEGELYVAGPQVAAGYLGRAPLTASRFVADPFADDGSRMYRTGDVVAWGGPDGDEIIFLGRNDSQIKLRGFRIELGEIEAAITEETHRTCLVRLHNESHGGQSLVAYVVTPEPLDSRQLRAGLASRVPQHMIPATFMAIPEIPLNRNGKVDLDALPEPVVRGTGGQMSSTQATVAQAMGEVLGIEDIGPDDSFFDFGGDSLLVTRLVRDLEEFGIVVTVGDVFSTPTPRGISKAKREVSDAELRRATPQLVRIPELPERTPLSPAQARMRFLNRLDVEGGMYNLSTALELRGNVDPDIFQRAIQSVVERQEILRTLYPTGPSGMPHQEVVPLSAIDWTQVISVSNDVVSRSDAIAAIRRDVGFGFDLLTDLPIRVRLVRVSESDWTLSIVLHHVASDGESVKPLLSDISIAYRELSSGQDMPPLPLRYRDYVIWNRKFLGDVKNEDSRAHCQLRFWVDRLGELPQEIPLPYDRKRPTDPEQTGSVVRRSIPEGVRRSFEDVASESQTSFFTTVHALVSTFLFKLTGASDIVVGTPVSGRSNQGLAPIVGLFVNSVVVRTQHSRGESFSDVVVAVAQWMAEALDNTDVPFEYLVDALQPQRTPGRNPLFQTMVVYDRYRGVYSGLELGEASVQSIIELESGYSKFDWTFEFAEMGDGRLELIIEYADELFDRQTVEMVGDALIRFCQQVADQPNAPLPILSLDEATRCVLLRTPPRTVDVSRGEKVSQRTVGDFIHTSSQAFPERRALSCVDESLTYSELENQVASIAAAISRRSPTGEFIGVLMNRSAQTVVAMNGILRAGYGYVPIDTSFPADRIQTILTQSGVSMVLSDLSPQDLTKLQLGGVEFVNFSRMLTDALALPERIATSSARPDSAAYMIFTSGTTGMPKGVVIEHRHVMALLDACFQSVDAAETDIFSCAHSFSFDFSVWEMFGAFAAGAELVVLPRDVVRSSDALANECARSGVTVLSQTPSSFYALIENSKSDFDRVPLRHVVFGGEGLNLSRIRPWWRTRAEDERPTLNNMYGITETTVHVTTNPLSDDDICHDPRSLIGVALPSLTVYVLDQNLDPCQPGVTGEMYVAGLQVARGYHDRPGLTASRFVANPFGSEGDRMYRSGDLARWVRSASGELVLAYEGRNDSQVKVRGFRIETGEVVAALQQLEGVTGAAVSTFRDETGAAQLVAWVTAANSGTEIRHELSSQVPSHLVPSLVTVVDEFPLTPNGKLDMKALPAPEFKGSSRAPSSERERIVHAILAAILGTEHFGVNDSFFDLGGHSLMSTIVVDRLREANLHLRVKDFFAHPTVTGIVEFATDTHDDEDEGWFAPVLEFGSGPIEIHCVHPGMGLAWRYSSLASALGSEVRVIGYQARGLGYRRPHYRDVGDAGDYIVAKVKESTARPGGPIWLSGWSFGGLAAFDAAVKLEAQGWEVGLILLDSWVVDDANFMDDEAGRDGIVRAVWEYAQGDPTDAPATVEELAVALRDTKLSLTLPQLQKLIAVGLNCSKLITGYQPATFHGPGLFVVASDARAAGLDARAWRSSFDKLTIEDVPAGHYALLEPDSIATTASRIWSFLQANKKFSLPPVEELSSSRDQP